jgi:hypothetical protein
VAHVPRIYYIWKPYLGLGLPHIEIFFFKVILSFFFLEEEAKKKK